MRRKPLTRDDVRIDGNQFAAVPVDAYRPQKPFKLGKRMAVLACPPPNERLWKPLIEGLGIEEIPRPTDTPRARGTCRCCGRPFFRIKRISLRYVGTRSGQCYEIDRPYLPQGQYCSNRCATKMRAASRTVARAAARTGRSCPVCGKAINASRSTKRYCTERCRVAAHRKGNP